jgi:YVTN family beta-propeller protein
MSKKVLLLIFVASSIRAIHAQTVAYVTVNQNNSLSVINTSTNRVVASIPVGTQPSGVASSPDGARVYVMNAGDNTISAIDTAADAVIATIALGGTAINGPELIAITPDGNWLYVATLQGNVYVVSTSANRVVATISVPGADAVAITPDGARAYVQTVSTGGVSVIDTATNAVVASIPTPSNESTGIAVAPGGAYVFATGGFLAPNIFKIATSSNTLVATIPCPGGPQGIAITPDGRKTYVGNELTNVVDVIEGRRTAELITVGHDPALLSLTPNGGFAYVSNFQDGTVSVIDASTNTVIATVPVGGSPEATAIADLNAPFRRFTVQDLDISEPKLRLNGGFTLSDNSPGIHFAYQPLTLTVGDFSLLVPAGTIKRLGAHRHYRFHGTIKGLRVNFDLKGKRGGSTAFDYRIQVSGPEVDTPARGRRRRHIPVVLKIGANTGTTMAEIR